ncbi:MAG: DUF1833 family protein [Planctomycetaceae bacterium]|nr:DUF1833 family protein [Planctomycetaceae bacterium]
MGRSLSSAAWAALAGQQTGEVFLLLAVLDHADLPAPLRVVANTEDVVSGGNTYTAYPFLVHLPQEREEEPVRVTLSICNVSKAIVDALRGLSSGPSVTLSVVLASSPSTVEAGPFELTLKDAAYDVLTVQGALGYEEVLDAPDLEDDYSPASFPAIF